MSPSQGRVRACLTEDESQRGKAGGAHRLAAVVGLDGQGSAVAIVGEIELHGGGDDFAVADKQTEQHG